MEDTLWVEYDAVTKTPVKVLILILLEDTLWVIGGQNDETKKQES